MSSLSRIIVGAIVALALMVFVGALFVVQQTHYGVVTQLGRISRVIAEPGLYFKVPFYENVQHLDKRILDLDLPVQSVLSLDRQNLEVDAFARFRIKNPVLFIQSVNTMAGADQRLKSITNSAMRNVLATASFPQIIRTDRAQLMNRIQDEVNKQAEQLGIEILDVRLTRVELPQANSQAVFERMKAERSQEAADLRANGIQAATTIRAKAERDVTVLMAEANRKAEELRGQGDAERNRIFAEAYSADQDFFAFYRSMQAYEQAFKRGDSKMVLNPQSEFLRYFANPSGQKAAPQK